MTFLTNTLNLRQEVGGTKVKQGDFGSTFTFTLTDEQGNYYHELNSKTATITLCDDNNIVYESTTLVSDSSVTFNIEKAVQTGVFYLEIKIDNYIFPSDRSCLISIEAGATAYDLKDLIPNYDVNMTIDGILSDLNRQGGSVVDLLNKMASIYSNALSDHAEIIQARGGQTNLDGRLDAIEAKEASDYSSLDARIITNVSGISATNTRIDGIIANAGNGTVSSEQVDERNGADGVVYTTAGTAQRTQFSNQLGLLATQIGTATVANEYIYRSNGVPVTSTYYSRSDMIDITGYSKLLVIASTNNDNAGYAFFNKYRVYISGSNAGTGTLRAEVVDIPANAKYFMYTTLSKDVAISKVFGHKIQDKYEVDALGVNEYELTYTKVDNYFIDVTGKVTANTGYYYSEPINIKKGEKLVVYNQDNSNAGIASVSEWTSSDTFVGAIIPGSIAGQTVNYVAPRDMIIKICGWKRGVMRVFKRTVNTEDILVTDIKQKLGLANIIPKPNFAIGIGKTIMIGDSLTSGAYDDSVFNGNSINQNMPFYYGKLTTNEVKNAGVSGIYPSKWLSDQYPKYNFVDYDSAYIWLGTNLGLTDTMDADVNTKATYNDYATTETGSYCKLIEMIKEQNPDISLHMSRVFAGPDVATTNKVIDQIATKYGIHLIDLSDLTKANYPQFHHDIGATHLNKAGNIFVANRLFNETNAYFDSNYFKLEFGLTPRTN
ncbi:SGNH/GDSL hydrolase family protein [Streptococcus parauberis]|uniref:SGNH/GDSL hydrolase family protein n=1 Tax=Streptococcus parauberis TaxID=1348 RepID=UPI0037B62FE2